MAALQEPARQMHADGTGHRPEQQALPAIAKWGPRPGSATFNSLSPADVTRTAQEPDYSAPTLAGMSLPLLHSASLSHQPQAPSPMVDQQQQQQQQELPAWFGPRP